MVSDVMTTPGSTDRFENETSATERVTVAATAFAVVLAVLLVAFTGTAVGADSATIAADPNTTNSVSTHTVRATIEDEDEGQGLESINVDYNSASRTSDVENVNMSDVAAIGIDSTGDGNIDIDLSDSFNGIEYDNNFHTITFHFDGTYELNKSDAVMVEYGDVVNPNEPGSYDTPISINYESTDHPDVASLHIQEDGTGLGTYVGAVNATPDEVLSGENVTNQLVEIEVFNVTADDSEDTITTEYPDALAGLITPNDATVVSGVGTAGNLTLVDGDDGDGLEDTLQVKINYSSQDSDSEDLVLRTDATIDYPTDPIGTQYALDVFVDDQDSDTDTDNALEEDVEFIEVIGQVAIVNGSADPTDVTSGTTVNNQQVTVSLSDVSADDNDDKHFVEFEDTLADNLSVNDVTVDGPAVVSHSAVLVDGFDDDGVVETVRFQTDTDGGGAVDFDITVDVSVEYPDITHTYSVDARTEDSRHGTDQENSVATITADTTSGGGNNVGGGSNDDEEDVEEEEEEEEKEEKEEEEQEELNETEEDAEPVSNFTVTNPSGMDIRVQFESRESVGEISLEIDGPARRTLDEGSFQRTDREDRYLYTAQVTAPRSGNYLVELVRAIGPSGDNLAGDNVASVSFADTDREETSAEQDPEPSVTDEGPDLSGADQGDASRDAPSDGPDGVGPVGTALAVLAVVALLGAAGMYAFTRD